LTPLGKTHSPNWLRAIWTEAQRAAGAVLALAAPGGCRICNELLAEASRLPICRNCLASFQQITGPICSVCGRPLGPWITVGPEAPRCQLCRRNTYAFSLARSYALYDAALTRAIVLLKYDAISPLGDWFGARLEELARRTPEALVADVVVPVPLHPLRLRERGYNQAELIAKPLARRLGLPLRNALLVRIKPRPDKLKLTRKERWATVRGAYAASPGAPIDNRRVMLVDDVFTSGATLDACARALTQAGAKSVIGLTVARVGERWTEFSMGGEVGLVRTSLDADIRPGGARTADEPKDASKG
jgi:ComF family protein